MLKKNNKKRKSGELFLLILSLLFSIFILICIIVIVKTNKDGGLSYKADKINGNTRITYSDEMETYHINDIFAKIGTIQKDSNTANIGIYTHIFKTEKNGTFGIKSSKIDLNAFEGKVEIKGIVSDIKNNMPIINVEEIKSIKEQTNDENTETLSGEQNNDIQTKFYFGENGFFVDFLNETGYDISSENGQIEIKNKNTNELLATIYPQICIKGDGLKDCSNLVSYYENSNSNTFVSSNKIKFYEIPEIKQWIFFNDNIWFYYIKASSADDITQISKYINTYDIADIKTKLSENIQNICQDSENQIVKIDDFKIENKNNSLLGTVIGQDSQLNTLKCEFDISMGNAPTTTLINISKTSSKSPTDQNSNSPIIDFSSTDYKEFTSRAGFTIKIPSKTIYQGFVVSPSENLGIAGIDCAYKVNITYYKKGTSFDSGGELDIDSIIKDNPELQAYYCTTSINDDLINELINGKNILHKIGSTSNNHFLIKYKDGEKDFANSIIVE